MDDPVLSALQSCYQEQVNQARHHETQRERMTALVIAIATAFVSVISNSAFGLRTLSLALLLIPLGIFGRAFGIKHYERNRLHTTVARHYLDAIDQHLAAPNATRPTNFLQGIMEAGREEHKEGFNASSQRNASVTELRLHDFWNRIHYMITILGIVLSVSIILLHFSTIRQWFCSGCP